MNLKKLIETKHPEEVTGVGVGIDTTDHLDFFCSKCKKPVDVVRMSTRCIKYDKKNKYVKKAIKLNPNVKVRTFEKCTWINFYCKSCNLFSYRKFYWTDERTNSFRIIHNDGSIIKNGVEIE